jgi:integrase
MQMRGHIVKRGKNSWGIVLGMGKDLATGKYKQRWVSFKGNKRDAEERLSELLHRLHHGDLVEPSKMTLEDFMLNRWLPSHAKNKNLAPRTVAGYRDQLVRHIIPALGSVRLVDLQPVTIDAYYTQSMENGRIDGKGGLSARSVKQHHAILHAALKDAVRWQMISRNPCDAVDAPRFQSPEGRIFELDEFRHFLGVANSDYPEYYALFYLMLFTGVRRSEALALRWGDVDLNVGKVSFTKALHCVNGEIRTSDRLKTPKSKRTLKLESANLVLREYREKREAMFQDMGITLGDDDFVFSRLNKMGDNGRPLPMLPDSVTHAWIRAVRRAGLTGLRLHDARHTNLSYQILAGNDLSVVSHNAGHSSVRVTADVYVKTLDDLKRNAALSFDKMVFGEQSQQETMAEDR